MAAKNISVKLMNEDDRDLLVFNFDKKMEIDLNNDDQKQLRMIFYHIVKRLFEEEIVFSLDYTDYTKPLYIDISKEYIDQLNAELSKLYEGLPDLKSK